jgi:hypothetical protein
MGGKTALTLLHCLLGPAIVVGGLWFAGRVGDTAPLAGLALAVAALILPFAIVSRVSWATGCEAGRRERDLNPPAG